MGLSKRTCRIGAMRNRVPALRLRSTKPSYDTSRRAWFIVVGEHLNSSANSSSPGRKVKSLKEGSPAFVTMRTLALWFNGILRGRRADSLHAWIDDAIETNPLPVMRVARTLHRDIDAVKSPSKCRGATART